MHARAVVVSEGRYKDVEVFRCTGCKAWHWTLGTAEACCTERSNLAKDRAKAKKLQPQVERVRN